MMARLSGGIDATEYMHAGHVAYQAYVTSHGAQDAPVWHGLIWAEQKAWCEAARAVKAIGQKEKT
jgi:hypothetical protein